jgi:hypothetical protein
MVLGFLKSHHLLVLVPKSSENAAAAAMIG